MPSTINIGAQNSAQAIGWSDAPLYRRAANSIVQRNGANAQTFAIANTWTDASNNELGVGRWNSNVFEIGTVANGTGSARNLDFITGGTARWRINTAGTLLPSATATYDIGASSLRPRDLFLSRNLKAAGGEIEFTGLPTSDPAVAGRLWNNSNVVNVSAG